MVETEFQKQGHDQTKFGHEDGGQLVALRFCAPWAQCRTDIPGAYAKPFANDAIISCRPFVG